MKRLLFSLFFCLALVACQTQVAAEATAVALPPTTAPSPVPTVKPTAVPATAVPPTTVPRPTPTSAPPSKLVQGTNGQPWWNDTVFYEVFVRSFYDSDGDGIGDLNGLIQKLDYLNDGDPTTDTDLGITGLWLMPIMQSPSYHGYDTTDYYQVDPDYGTNEDFQRLMTEAHARGIRVIVDLVMNHTSAQHPWFEASQDPSSDKRDWYVWSETDPGYRGPQGQQVWYKGDDGYYYAVFWDQMPDLNYQNPDVTAEMDNVARYWLADMGADGFRLDAVKHLIEKGQLQENTSDTHAWLQAFHKFYKGINSDAVAVGEAWTQTQQVLKYTGNEVDIAFAFDLAEKLITSANSGFATQIGKEQAQMVADFPPGQYATFLTNHDQNRILTQLNGDENKAKNAATWLLTSPGVPFLYYGEEIGLMGKKPDEDIRRPMQWTSDDFKVGFSTAVAWHAPSTDYQTRSVALQQDDPASLLAHYQSLIRLRNTHEALRVGDWQAVTTNAPGVYAYIRSTENETLLVIINWDDAETSDYSLTWDGGADLGTAVTVLLNTSVMATPADLTPNDGGGFTDYQPYATLPAESSFVLQLK